MELASHRLADACLCLYDEQHVIVKRLISVDFCLQPRLIEGPAIGHVAPPAQLPAGEQRLVKDDAIHILDGVCGLLSDAEGVGHHLQLCHIIHFVGIGLPCAANIHLLLSHEIPFSRKRKQRDIKQYLFHFACKVKTKMPKMPNVMVHK